MNVIEELNKCGIVCKLKATESVQIAGGIDYEIRFFKGERQAYTTTTSLSIKTLDSLLRIFLKELYRGNPHLQSLKPLFEDVLVKLVFIILLEEEERQTNS